MPVSVRVPTTFDSPQTYDRLFELYNAALIALSQDRIVELDFTSCTFLHQNAVAFLGGMIRELQHRGCSILAKSGSFDPSVQRNLQKNGFLNAFRLENSVGRANTIPFREDRTRDDGSFLQYLREAWLGRGWVDVSDRVADAISNAVWEAYTNAFEHGNSATGLFTCGQFYPNKQEIALSFVDFGIGIPGSVRTVPEAANLDDGETIGWALTRGNTSKPGNRGVGLDILRAFMELNQGRMDVISHRGHVRITGGSEHRLKRNCGFPGTIFNITLKADEKRYAFKSEIDAESIF